MMTSYIEMLQLPNFGDMTTHIIQFDLHDKLLLVTSWTEIITSVINFILRYFYLKKN